jgi:site-specific recombinase XerD
MLGDGVDIRLIQITLGHSTGQQTQRYLNVTDEEVRRRMQPTFIKRRQLELLRVNS